MAQLLNFTNSSNKKEAARDLYTLSLSTYIGFLLMSAEKALIDSADGHVKVSLQCLFSGTMMYSCKKNLKKKR